MSRFRFLHAADLHLDSALRGLEADAPAERIRTATRQALVNLVDLALTEEVAFVLLAGDLYDGDWEDWPTGQFLITQIGRLTRAGIPVYAIRGNHDAESVLTRDLRWPEGAHLFDSRAAHHLTVPGLDVVIHGRSFPQRAVKDEAFARAYPAPVPGMLNIGLLHTACGSGAHENYAPCTVEQLIGHGYDYWALGHVHQRAVLHEHPTWVVFPGNLQGRHINEPGPKGATLVHVEGRRLTPEHRTLDVVRWGWIEVDLTGAADLDAVYGRIRAGLLRAVDDAAGVWLAARILLLGATAMHGKLAQDPERTREDIRAEVNGLGLGGQIWVQSAMVATQPAVDLAARRDGADAMATLVRALDLPPADDVSAAIRDYVAHMLDRAPRLRQALDPDHPAMQALSADLPEALVVRARALLLARLAEG
jgi:DNA repair exonuclease SbcCD nuclease subunit